MGYRNFSGIHFYTDIPNNNLTICEQACESPTYTPVAHINRILVPTSPHLDNQNAYSHSNEQQVWEVRMQTNLVVLAVQS